MGVSFTAFRSACYGLHFVSVLRTACAPSACLTRDANNLLIKPNKTPAKFFLPHFQTLQKKKHHFFETYEIVFTFAGL
ncbi:MAG: hypothetical protein RML94_07910 [Bacteroidia bacterium]|nr:hypothetical protein [Bacteroidia bacterium]